MRFALMFLLFIPALLTPQTPSEQPEKPLYRSTGKEATLLGSITVKGSVPKPLRIDMIADPVCMELNPKPETRPFIANEGGLLNAFVYVKSESLKQYRFAMPASEVNLQRVKCQYEPHVLGLRVGQKLVIVNNDPTHHNTHPTPQFNREWNQTQAAGAEPLVKSFPNEEALIPFKCNHHPWERAYVGVMDHPFFAVSNELGNYEISGLPPGTYKLVGSHEAFAEKELEITLVAGEMRRVDFVYDVDKDLKTGWPSWLPKGVVKQ